MFIVVRSYNTPAGRRFAFQKAIPTAGDVIVGATVRRRGRLCVAINGHPVPVPEFPALYDAAAVFRAHRPEVSCELKGAA